MGPSSKKTCTIWTRRGSCSLCLGLSRCLWEERTCGRIREYCFANNIRLCPLPSHTSHKLQSCDVAVFAPLKTTYRDAVERLERGGVGTIGKQHFTSLYSPAREAAFTKRNITARWSKAGLVPLNPQRVLKDMRKPLIEAPEAAEPWILVPRASQNEIPASSVAPVTPVTPVTAEAFASLRDLILERDAHALDDLGKRILQRHLQKLTKAAQTTFVARGALQQEQIKFLRDINKEAQTRRSTKSLVLGKAKVMSYEDLEAARARRKEEGDRTAKKKPGRKRRGGAKKTCMAEASQAMPQQAEMQPGNLISPLAPCPGRAPVADPKAQFLLSLWYM